MTELRSAERAVKAAYLETMTAQSNFIQSIKKAHSLKITDQRIRELIGFKYSRSRIQQLRTGGKD